MNVLRIFLFFLGIVTVYGQEDILSFIVTDSVTGKPIGGVEVVYATETHYTSEKGKIILKRKEDDFVYFFKEGYHPRLVNIFSGIKNVRLSPLIVNLESVTISFPRNKAKTIFDNLNNRESSNGITGAIYPSMLLSFRFKDTTLYGRRVTLWQFKTTCVNDFGGRKWHSEKLEIRMYMLIDSIPYLIGKDTFDIRFGKKQTLEFLPSEPAFISDEPFIFIFTNLQAVDVAGKHTNKILLLNLAFTKRRKKIPPLEVKIRPVLIPYLLTHPEGVLLTSRQINGMPLMRIEVE